MSEDIETLQAELKIISEKIYLLKDRINSTQCSSQHKKLQADLKQLQWQALFYLEKIENLKEQENPGI